MSRFLRLFCFVLALAPWSSIPAQTIAESVVPPDTAILELALPAGTRFKINDEPYRASTASETRVLPFRLLRPGQTATYQLEVQFADGEITQRTLALRGGERVRLPMRASRAPRPEIVVQTGEASGMVSAAFSPEGKRLLIGFNEMVFHLWDIESGTKLRMFRGLPADMSSLSVQVAFSQDGNLAMTDSFYEGPILWEVETGKRLRNFPGSFSAAALGPEGRRLAIARKTKQQEPSNLSIWNVETGLVAQSLNGHTDTVGTIAFSPNGELLLTGSKDKTAIVWDAESGEKKFVLREHGAQVSSAAFRSDGHLFLTGSDDGTAILWDTATGEKLRTFRGHKVKEKYADLGVKCVSFCPDGKRIVTGGSEPTAIEWNAKTGERLKTLDAGSVVAVSPDGRRLLARPDKNDWYALTLWDLETSAKLHTFDTRSDALRADTFSPDGHRLLTTSSWSTSMIWNLESGTLQSSIAGGGRSSLDGRRAVMKTQNNSIVVVDADTGLPLRTFNGIDDKSLTVGNVVTRYDTIINRFVTQDGSRFLTNVRKTVSDEDSERSFTLAAETVWDVDSGDKFVISNAFAFSPDGRRLLTTDSRTKATLWTWNANARTKLATLDIEVGGYSKDAVFSPDSRKLAARSSDGALTLWNAETGEKLNAINASSENHKWIFSPDSRRLVTTSVDDHGNSSDGVAKLWDVESGSGLRRFQGYGARFSADGRRLVTRRSIGRRHGDDGAIDVWDTETGSLLQTIADSANAGLYPIFTPDGGKLATQTTDWTTQFLDVATGDKLANLISVNDGKDWLVFTPEGLFDGSAAARQRVMFRVGGGLKVVPVDRFFQDFYYPGLLAAIMRGERPMPDVDLSGKLPPEIRIVSHEKLAGRRYVIETEAIDQGGGIDGPRLKFGSAFVLAEETERKADSVRRRFVVALNEGLNRFEVHAANRDAGATWESDPKVLTASFDEPVAKPKLHLLIVGVNRYASDPLQLRFPTGDVQRIAQLFKERGSALYEQVLVTSLLDEEATKPRILSAIRGIAQRCDSQDVFVACFAGHGSVLTNSKKNGNEADAGYYFLPHDVVAANAIEGGLSQWDLQNELLGIPALKRLVIFDSGQSGQALGVRRSTRSLAGLRGASERLSRATGAFSILAAPLSDKSREIPALGHGVLTYSLLAGMKGVKSGPLADQWIKTAEEDGVASTLEWFGFADRNARNLTREMFGETQDIAYTVSGNNFPILPVGRVSAGGQVAAVDSPRTETIAPPTNPIRRADAKSTVFVVTVGINQYKHEPLNLKLARQDAEAIAKLFQKRGKALHADVQITSLLDQQATRSNILATLAKVSQVATPEDMLVLFFAGHGTMVGQRYYFIPHEYQPGANNQEQDIRKQGLAADELADPLAEIKAKHRLLIFDTCSSGGAVQVGKTGTAYEFRGAVAGLSRGSGTFVIAATSAADEVPEPQALGHGFLTYSLLAGVSAAEGGPLQNSPIQSTHRDQTVHALDWIEFAARHVPRLSKKFYGHEQQVHSGGTGVSFPVLPLYDFRLDEPLAR